MTQSPEMPERIWARDNGDWLSKPFYGDGGTEHRRADLPPTDAECLRNGRVRALVEAVPDLLDIVGKSKPEAVSVAVFLHVRAALAALEQEAGRG